MTNYPMRLRPKLHPKRFRAVTPDWWQRVDVTTYGAQWGGEVAVEKLTGYLKPGTVTLYVRPGKDRENVTQLVAKHRLRAESPRGHRAARPLLGCAGRSRAPSIVRPILVYADLVAARTIRATSTLHDCSTTERSRMLCVKPDRPVDPIALSVMRAVDAVAKELGLSYFLVGAMARDVLLGHVFGLDPGRATRDVDVAFALESWEQFRQIQDRLIAGGRFVAAPNIPHRLLFSVEGTAQQYIVDLIPFGGVEQSAHTIAWPPDLHMMMHVAGFAEALQTAPLVQVATGLMIHVVSLPGLAMLKLLAWQERGLADPRDAIDVVTLCRHYTEAGNLERVYVEALPALQAVGFDTGVRWKWAPWQGYCGHGVATDAPATSGAAQ